MNKTAQTKSIDLNIGIDLEEMTHKPEISKTTMEKAGKIIAFDKQEYAALARIREKKRLDEQLKEDGIERAFRLLKTSATKQGGIPATEIAATSGSADLSSVMLRLRNYIKKRGGLWKIIKYQRNKQTVYKMEPTTAEEES